MIDKAQRYDSNFQEVGQPENLEWGHNNMWGLGVIEQMNKQLQIICYYYLAS